VWVAVVVVKNYEACVKVEGRKMQHYSTAQHSTAWCLCHGQVSQLRLPHSWSPYQKVWETGLPRCLGSSLWWCLR